MSEVVGSNLDNEQLRQRGGTRTMVKRFLGEPDGREAVEHWANYAGKATYNHQRIIAAEQLEEFRHCFQGSARRRKLGDEDLQTISAARERLDGVYFVWAAKRTGPETELERIASAFAAVSESARARGYRTPHK